MVRTSVLAGSWYPGTKEDLLAVIDGYLDNVPDLTGNAELFGLVSPHAGYAFSGQTAAYGYGQLRGRSYDHIVILSPMHRFAPGRYVINRASFYETPLGRVSVNTQIVEQLAQKIEIEFVDSDNEHSIEIQLPFLQRVCADFDIVPIMIGHDNFSEASSLAATLTSMFSGSSTLFVASSDMHHFSDYREVVRRDTVVRRALESFNPKKINRALSAPGCTVCGKIPVSVIAELGAGMGAAQLKILHQTNSAEITGEKTPGSYTVGYLSAAVVR